MSAMRKMKRNKLNVKIYELRSKFDVASLEELVKDEIIENNGNITGPWCMFKQALISYKENKIIENIDDLFIVATYDDPMIAVFDNTNNKKWCITLNYNNIACIYNIFPAVLIGNSIKLI